jgi:predicted MarR family transcription regulator
LSDFADKGSSAHLAAAHSCGLIRLECAFAGASAPAFSSMSSRCMKKISPRATLKLPEIKLQAVASAAV